MVNNRLEAMLVSLMCNRYKPKILLRLIIQYMVIMKRKTVKDMRPCNKLRLMLNLLINKREANCSTALQ